MFDTSVTPRWLETSDRFWYSYNTREGRRFMLVDPVKKTKAPLFDHAKMAAALTTITRIPYDAQHLPFTQVRFIKNDAAFEFEVQVPRDAVIPTTKPKAITTDQQGGGGERRADSTSSTWTRIRCSRASRSSSSSAGRAASAAPVAGRPRRRAARTKTLHFEYDMATAKVTLIEDYPEEPRRPTWGSLSPDGKTVLFARNHNLFMMDAANCEKAQKNAERQDDRRDQLTTDGEEHYSYRRRRPRRRTAATATAAAADSRTTRSRSSRSSRARTPRTSACAPATSSGRRTRASSR